MSYLVPRLNQYSTGRKIGLQGVREQADFLEVRQRIGLVHCFHQRW